MVPKRISQPSTVPQKRCVGLSYWANRGSGRCWLEAAALEGQGVGRNLARGRAVLKERLEEADSTGWG